MGKHFELPICKKIREGISRFDRRNGTFWVELTAKEMRNEMAKIIFLVEGDNNDKMRELHLAYKEATKGNNELLEALYRKTFPERLNYRVGADKKTAGDTGKREGSAEDAKKLPKIKKIDTYA